MINKKKMSKEELYKLLKNKGDKTFKQLSKMTGYHEKYLIRMHSQIMENGLPKPKKREAYNKINQNSIKNLKKLYSENNFISKKDFYRFLKEKNIYTPSYSKLCSILKEKKSHPNTCVMVKYVVHYMPVYVAFDYDSRDILFIIENVYNNKEAFHIMMSTLVRQYGAPRFVMCDKLFSHDKEYYKDYLEQYAIKSIDSDREIRGAIRKVRKQLNLSMKRKSQVRYRACLYDEKSLYFKKEIHINDNLTLQFQNKLYKVNNSVSKGKALIFYDRDNSVKLVEQNGVASDVEEIKRKESKRGLTKY